MKLLVLSGLVVLACLASEPGKPNFSGTWKLDVQRSRFDQVKAPKNLVMKIDHQEPKLQITIEQGGTATFDMTTDGAEHPAMVNGAPATASAAWDGDHLLFTVKQTSPEGVPVTTTRRLRLGDK